MKKIILFLMMVTSFQVSAKYSVVAEEPKIPYNDLLGMLLTGMPGSPEVNEVYRYGGRDLVFDPYTDGQFDKAHKSRFDVLPDSETVGYHDDMRNMVNIFRGVQHSYEDLNLLNVNLLDTTGFPRRAAPISYGPSPFGSSSSSL